MEEKALEDFHKKNPFVANVAEGVGMLAPAVVSSGWSMGPTAVRAGAKTAGLASTEALKRPGFIRRAAQGTAAGGGYGAVYGSGKAEGGLEERLAGAVEPGAVGAVMGAATPIVGAIARPIIEHLKKRLVAKRTGVNPRALDPIQEALEEGSRGAPGGVKEPVPETYWADIFPNTRGLLVESLEKLGNFGLKGRARIEARGDAAGPRMTQALDEALGTPEGLETAVARMTAESKPILDRLYGQAEATIIRYDLPNGKKLLNLIKGRRVPKQALTDAQKLLDADDHYSRQGLFKLDADGNVLDLVRVPDVKEVRAIIDGMQQLIEGQRSDIPGKFKPLGRSLIKVQQDMKEWLGDLVPTYREASAIAEPQFLAKDAIKLGEEAVSVNMSASRFQAGVNALKKEHPAIEDMTAPFVRMGMRNRMQDLSERAKNPLAPTPTQAGNISRGAARDPTATKAIQDLTSEGLQRKVSLVAEPGKATHLFKEVGTSIEHILTRDTLAENVRRQARLSLGDAAENASIIGDIKFGNFGSAGARVMNAYRKKQQGKQPDETAALVANALVLPANKKAMDQVRGLGRKSERGMVGSRRAEALGGGTGLVAATGIQDDKTRARAGAEYLLGLADAR